jgi:hypothetical protein
MDKWVKNLQKCWCWHPELNAKALLDCECVKCDHSCYSGKFKIITDIIRVGNIYGYSLETHQSIKECVDAMVSTDIIEQAYILNKKLVVQMLSLDATTSVLHRYKCNHYDRALLKSQGYYGNAPKQFGSTWKPYTITYPLKDTVASVKMTLPIPTSSLETELHTRAQENANRIWTQAGIKSYVDFANGIKTPTDESKVNLSYDRNIVVFPRKQAYRSCPNIFGEFFEFYDGKELASGLYQESFRYLSQTQVGNHTQIDKHSHTNTHRSDCSLWFTYHQQKYSALAQQAWQHPQRKSILSRLRSEINSLRLTPPTCDRERYNMWLEIRPNRKIKALPQLKLMTI